MTSLDTRIVAFVDLLGYKDMVIHDSEHPAHESKYVDKLYKISKHTKNDIDKAIDIRFFSDCAVLASKPTFVAFRTICETCRRLQSTFLAEEILVRGGISFGKHFADADFLFSRGLVDAYLLEAQKARTPRIVISPDLIELYRDQDMSFLVRERDGLAFIDYLDSTQPNQVEVAQRLIDTGINNPVLAEKMLWLGEYINFRFGPNSVKLTPRFSKP